MGVTHDRSPSSNARECCVHEAIHSRKMEGIHTGVVPRRQEDLRASSGTASARRPRQ